MEKVDYKAKLKKTEKGTYIIRARFFYGEEYIGPEYVEVKENLLDFLIDEKRKEKRKKEEDYRKCVAFGFEEESAAEMLGIVVPSAEEQYINKCEISAMYAALGEIDNASARRFYLRHADDRKQTQIAEMEKVTPAAIHYNLKTTKDKLRKLLCNFDKEDDV